MKIFATSDLHGNLEGLNPSGCDIVIIAGDFAKMFGWGVWHLNNMRKWIEKKFIPFTLSYPETKFIITPGNHDLIFDKTWSTRYPGMDYSVNFPSNVHVLINDEIIINGLRIYGTPNIPPISGSWAFETSDSIQQLIFSKIPENLDILITHSPPRFGNIDVSLQYNNPMQFGSKYLYDEIVNKKPKYVFCGHIHSGDHSKNIIGESIVYNVSHLNEDYNIAYDPVILDI